MSEIILQAAVYGAAAGAAVIAFVAVIAVGAWLLSVVGLL